MTLRQLGSNMTLLVFPGKEIFFSYETPVGAWTFDRGYIVSTTWYSRTTSKHITKWLDGKRATAVEQSEIDNLC